MDTYLPEKYKNKIVHCKRQKYDVYCGRPSIFGNPMKIGKKIHQKPEPVTREEAINWYKEYFYTRIKTDLQFKRAVDKLKGKVLGCWCYPKDCHLRIIIDYLEGEYNG